MLTCVFLGLFLLGLTVIPSHNIAFGQALKLPSVKIESPLAGENIGDNDTLILRGVSSDTSSNDCQVSIILNDVRPYQPVVPIKEGDYSSWTYTLSSSYTAIKNGYNKATAKITCIGTPENVTKWNSINFTRTSVSDIANNVSGIQSVPPTQDNLENFGLNASTTENTTGVEPQNNTGGGSTDNASSSNMDLNVGTENTTGVESQNNTGGGSTDNASSATNIPTTPRPISMRVMLEKNPISVGSLQTAIVNVSDSVTGKPVVNATIKAGITSPSGKIINFENMTNSRGSTSFSWIVARVAETGNFDVNLNGSAIGYISNQTSSSYEVVKDPSLRNQTVSPFS